MNQILSTFLLAFDSIFWMSVLAAADGGEHIDMFMRVFTAWVFALHLLALWG